jgi:predicted SAM-dependent methyltransferase
MYHNQKINCVYHVAAMGNWQEVVTEQLALAARVGLQFMHCTFVGTGLDWLLKEAKRHGVALTIDRSDPNIMHYETFAFLCIERLAKESNKPILYWHTKGVSVPGHAGKRRWRLLMQRLLIEPWRENLRFLDNFNAVGVNWRNFGSVPHFSGNFWLARASWIRSLPDYVGYHVGQGLTRTSCEFWIGSRPLPTIVSLGCTEQDFCRDDYDWDALDRQIEAGEAGVKLNLGCWNFYHPGWINVDLDTTIKADLYEDVEILPTIGEKTVDKIYAGHVAEHVIDLAAALKRWYALLKPGGTCTVVVPDLPGAISLWRAGQVFPGILYPPEEGLVAICAGVRTAAEANRKELQLHRRCFDASTLQLCMEAVGFQAVHACDHHPLMVMSNRDLGWQIGMTGIRPK